MKPKSTWRSIGEYIRFRRIQEEMTIRQLADRSGITSTLLFNIEAGNNEPKLRSLESIAKGFGESELKFLGRFYARRARRNGRK